MSLSLSLLLAVLRTMLRIEGFYVMYLNLIFMCDDLFWKGKMGAVIGKN